MTNTEINTKKIIRLHCNENPLGCSKKVYEHISKIEPQMYPDVYSPKLRNAIAEKYAVDVNRVFCGGSGSDNLIRVITQALVKEGEEIIIPEIAFPTYIMASNMVSAKSVLVPLKDYAIDLQGMVNAITNKTKLIWFSNPHNPTGTIFSKYELEEILDKIPSGVIFVMDEAYIELVKDKNCANSLDYKDKYPNMIILRTLSKTYGLASMRIGYGIATEDLVNKFYKIIGAYDVNTFAQECAVIALKDSKFIEDVSNLVALQRNFLYEIFDSLNLPYIKSNANFIMIYAGDNHKHIVDELQNRNIFVKAGYLIGMDKWIRVSVGSYEDNKIFADNLRDILK